MFVKTFEKNMPTHGIFVIATYIDRYGIARNSRTGLEKGAGSQDSQKARGRTSDTYKGWSI